MAPDHMTSPPMRFENGLETQPLPPHPPPRALTADTDVVNSDTYDEELILARRPENSAPANVTKIGIKIIPREEGNKMCERN